MLETSEPVSFLSLSMNITTDFHIYFKLLQNDVNWFCNLHNKPPSFLPVHAGASDASQPIRGCAHLGQGRRAVGPDGRAARLAMPRLEPPRHVRAARRPPGSRSWGREAQR